MTYAMDPQKNAHAVLHSFLLGIALIAAGLGIGWYMIQADVDSLLCEHIVGTCLGMGVTIVVAAFFVSIGPDWKEWGY
jgi:hypothetical protein